jgi:hypothetical protein
MTFDGDCPWRVACVETTRARYTLEDGIKRVAEAILPLKSAGWMRVIRQGKR